jgi:glycerol-3-phosphate responsive antiterminator
LKQALKEVEEIKRLYEAMKKTKSMYLKNDLAKGIHNKKEELKFYCKCKKINIRDLFDD